MVRANSYKMENTKVISDVNAAAAALLLPLSSDNPSVRMSSTLTGSCSGRDS